MVGLHALGNRKSRRIFLNRSERGDRLRVRRGPAPCRRGQVFENSGRRTRSVSVFGSSADRADRGFSRFWPSIHVDSPGDDRVGNVSGPPRSHRLHPAGFFRPSGPPDVDDLGSSVLDAHPLPSTGSDFVLGVNQPFVSIRRKGGSGSRASMSGARVCRDCVPRTRVFITIAHRFFHQHGPGGGRDTRSGGIPDSDEGPHKALAAARRSGNA